MNSFENSENQKRNKQKKKVPTTTRIVPQSEIINGPLLSIEEVGNCSILNHNKLILNPGGLVGGRNANDGVSYFTCNMNPNDTGVSDFVLNLKKIEGDIDDFIFIVYYKEENKKYYIKFSENTNVNKDIFLHLFNAMSMQIKQTEVISFGNFIFQIVPDKSKIRLINLNNDEKYDYTFKNGIITIGRNENCNICLDENGVSKIQCSLEYKDGGWTLHDGYDGKKSTNGIYIAASHSYVLEEGMEIEVLSSVIKFNYY